MKKIYSNSYEEALFDKTNPVSFGKTFKKSPPTAHL
jgi:hypothetical protein